LSTHAVVRLLAPLVAEDILPAWRSRTLVGCSASYWCSR